MLSVRRTRSHSADSARPITALLAVLAGAVLALGLLTVAPAATAAPSSSAAVNATNAAPSTAARSATTAKQKQTPAQRYRGAVRNRTNAARANHGLGKLGGQKCVQGFAQRHAERMARERRMYHQDLGPILRRCGLSSVGENVAFGYPTGAAVVRAWMNSPGHRANILGRFRLLGVGVARNGGQWYAVQVFATR